MSRPDHTACTWSTLPIRRIRASSGSFDTPGNAVAVAVSGNYAYIADSDSGLQVIDITDPAAPTSVGSHDSTFVCDMVEVSGSYAYVGVSENGKVLVYDVSDSVGSGSRGRLLGAVDVLSGLDVSRQYPVRSGRVQRHSRRGRYHRPDRPDLDQ